MHAPRILHTVALGFLVLLALAPATWAADFPNRPVRIVVPSSPGGALDILARLLSPRLTKKWGQSVVVDNHSGGNGIVGTQAVARAKPDGHTLIILSANFTINPFVYTQLPYKTTDFQPITAVSLTSYVLVVHPSAKFRSLQELIAISKQNPGSVTYASSGVGSSGHLSMALVERLTGIKMTHVPYKGAGDASLAVMKGEVAMLTTAISTVFRFIENGTVIPLCVTTPKRSPVLPNVPTFAESGLPGYDVTGWYGIFAPTGTPKEIIDKIYSDIVEVLRNPEITKKINAIGLEIGGNSPADFTSFIKDDLKKWEPTVKAAGIQAE
jgi:tripartite-type tricarboxylate transporter receptor subunit TctC